MSEEPEKREPEEAQPEQPAEEASAPQPEPQPAPEPAPAAAPEPPAEPTPAPVPPAVEPEPAPAVAGDAEVSDMDEGKVFAILCYAINFIGLPFFIIPLIMRNNEYSLFHAKQSLMIWLLAIVGNVLGAILTAVCIGPIICAVAVIVCLVLNVLGLISAIQGTAKPLPLIGQWGIDWFKGIKKV